MSEVKTSNMWLLSCMGMVLMVCAMLIGIVYAGSQAYKNLMPSLNSKNSPRKTSVILKKNMVLGQVRVCRKIQNNQPVGTDEVFSSSDQIFFYMPILKQGTHRVVVRCSKAGLKTMIRLPVTTDSIWRYCWVYFTPYAYRRPEGTWTAKIYVNGILEQQLTFEVRR